MPSRQYTSPLRAERARQTRLAIIEAALRLFIERGYSDTSIRALARAAGVAERTVYVAFDDKISILTAIADHEYYGGTEAGEGEARFLRSLEAEPDPRARLRMAVHQGTLGKERGLAMIARMVRSTAPSDPRLQQFADAMVEHRHQATRALVEIVLGHELPEEDSYEQMIDELEAIGSEEGYLLLAVERGWPREQYEQYVVDLSLLTLKRYGLELA